MEYILAGLLMGIMGSFHCAGMCGPIVLAIPLPGDAWYAKVIGAHFLSFGKDFNVYHYGASVWTHWFRFFASRHSAVGSNGNRYSDGSFGTIALYNKEKTLFQHLF